MASIKLYIATTLDGYIAKNDGNLDWLHDLPNTNQSDFGYGEFISGIDTLIMGRSTYDAIIGFGIEWPYKDSITYVVSQNKDLVLSSPNTHLLNELSAEQIDQIKNSSTKGIWLVGGGQLVSHFLELRLIDEMILSIVPKLIGSGIPLFPPIQTEQDFILTRTESFENGLVSLHYTKCKA